MKIIGEECEDGSAFNDSSTNNAELHNKGRFRVGFKCMTSGQLCPPIASAPEKIKSYESTSSLASLTGSSGRNHDTDLETFSEESRISGVQEQRPASVRWQVENSTKVVRNGKGERDESASSGSVDDDVEREVEDIKSDEGAEVSTETQISLKDETDTTIETTSNVQSNQTVDILMSFTKEKKPADSRRMSYRHHQVKNLSIRPPQSGLGEVKSDGLTSSNAFSGLPVASQKPFMPFLNGILQKIIRLNELPNFLRSQTANFDCGEKFNSNNGANEQGYLWVQSPGNSSGDPKLMMINFGKFRSISNLLMLIRSSQLTPFSLHVDFAVQAMLYRDAMYKSEDDIWERSSELE